ncbi:unannotated protein [freshwater metagenome]|uniref:Unannotated protein n=1 Tax=freshwater metagenome TaxID=449393 RepID=A0A6J6M1M3_9ZZZZ
MRESISSSTIVSSRRRRSSSFEISVRITFNSEGVHGVSDSLTTIGVGALLIGFSGATFLPFLAGRGGGGMTNRRSSTTGTKTGAVTVETETV